MRRYLPLFFLILASLCYPLLKEFSYSKTHHFSMQSVQLRMPSSKEIYFKSASFNETMLKQPFRYYSSGGQAFIFISEDEKYILKLFRGETYREPLWMSFTLAKPRKKKLDRITQRISRDLGSYQIAVQEFEAESAIIAMQIGKEDNFPKISIQDPLGSLATLNLSKVDFILQKKIEPLYDHIAQAVQKGHAEKAIDSIIELFKLRSSKGIYDEDAKIERNLGFIEDKAVFIDLGSFIPSPSHLDKKTQIEDLTRETRRLQTWLNQNYPPLGKYLEDKLSNYF